MNSEERMKRAQLSLARAMEHKDERDVSEEICSCIANLMATGQSFAAIGTSEHEIRSILGQGFIAETKRVLRHWSLVPRPTMPSSPSRLNELIKRAEGAYALVEVKMDNDTAILLAEKDPFLAAHGDEALSVRSRSDAAELLRDVDLDALFSADEPAISGIVSAENIEEIPPEDVVAVTELDEPWFNEHPVSLRPPMLRSLPPPPPSFVDGIVDSDLERRWFKRTG
jgi:hypothetical protein